MAAAEYGSKFRQRRQSGGYRVLSGAAERDYCSSSSTTAAAVARDGGSGEGSIGSRAASVRGYEHVLSREVDGRLPH